MLHRCFKNILLPLQTYLFDRDMDLSSHTIDNCSSGPVGNCRQYRFVIEAACGFDLLLPCSTISLSWLRILQLVAGSGPVIAAPEARRALKQGFLIGWFVGGTGG